MKKGLAKILTVALATTLGFSVLGGCSNKQSKVDLSGYVAVDVNPSIEFITNKDGMVTEVRAVNDDAKILLSDMTLTGIDISVAVERVARSSEETGFINETNTDVSITVSGETETAEKTLTERAENGVKKGSAIATISADEIRVALEEQVAKLKADNPELYKDLTVAKLKLINSIMKYDRNFTVEVGVKMNTGKLVDILEDYIDEYEDFIDDSLENAFEKAFDLAFSVYAVEINAKLDAIYGEGFGERQETLRKLELMEDEFELELERASVNAGTHFRFDDERAPLTDEMKEKIVAVIGENKFTTLGQFDDYVEDLDDELEEITERTRLTDEQRKIVNEIKAQVAKIKVEAMESIKTMAELTRESYRQKKERLIETAQNK